MTQSAACVHAIAGRLRIKVAAVKRSPARCEEIERDLVALTGIEEVRANPTTGSVLVRYRPESQKPDDILGFLHESGWLQPTDVQSGGTAETLGLNYRRKAAETMVAVLMEAALKGVVGGLA